MTYAETVQLVFVGKPQL